MQPQWKCKHCGLGAHSKCPSQRNVFPEGNSHMLGNLTTVTDHERVEGMKTVSVNLVVYEGENPLSLLRDMLVGKSDEELKQATCYHEWKIQYGTCDFGCHKSRKPEPVS